MWGLCFESANENPVGAKENENRCSESEIVMVTETGMSDLSKSSRHLVDFQDPVSGCSVYVLACPDHTVYITRSLG